MSIYDYLHIKNRMLRARLSKVGGVSAGNESGLPVDTIAESRPSLDCPQSELDADEENSKLGEK